MNIYKLFFVVQLSLLLSLISLILPANAENKVIAKEKLLASFNRMPIASGTFKQRKYFAVLKQPILSQGTIFIDKKLGLIWQTTLPVYSQMILKPSGLYSDDGINPIQKIKADNTLIKSLMYAMLGDINVLNEQFKTQLNETQYCLMLTPKKEQLARMIKLIKLCDHKKNTIKSTTKSLVENITLFEHSGNRTEIDLTLTPLTLLPEAIREQLQ